MKLNKSYSNSFSFLKKYWKEILFVVLLDFSAIICSLIIPYLLGKVIHSLEINNVTYAYLLRGFVIIAILYAAWDICTGIEDVVFEKVNKSIENDIRAFCYERLLNADMVMLQDRSEGEIITKVIRDTEKLEKAFSNLFSLVMSIIRTLGLVTMMLLTNVTLALVLLVFFAIIVFINRCTAKPLKQLYNNYKGSEEKLLSDLKNQIAGFLTIKVFSLEDKSINILKQNNDINLDNHIKTSKKVSMIKNTNFFVGSIFRITTVFVGGILYIVKRINIGQIFSIYTYAIQISYELRSIIEIDIKIKDIAASFKRVTEFIIEFDNSSIETEAITAIEKIEFEKVNFKYGDRQLFSDLSFKANKNQVIGLKGQNGSGKTTLTYIICGFYKPDGVYINNKSSKLFSEKEMLKNVSYVLQNTYLFPSTIMNNLTCFGSIAEERVYDVCQKLGMHDKIMSFSDGYQTIVNEKNLNLSGGEKQLIALARAILKDSSVLILDEMNSAMDIATEDRIFQTIKEFFKDRIVFIISHREKLFDICDYIVKL